MKTRTAITLLCLLACFLSCAKMDSPRRIQPGEKLPSFSVRMNDGRTVSDKTLSDGRSLIVFFHTGCPDCVQELEQLQPFYSKYKDSVQIILISRQQGKDQIEEYWSEHGYTLPFSAQTDRKIYELFSDSGIPFCVLSQDGTVLKTWDDTLLFNEEEYLKTLD